MKSLDSVIVLYEDIMFLLYYCVDTYVPFNPLRPCDLSER